MVLLTTAFPASVLIFLADLAAAELPPSNMTFPPGVNLQCTDPAVMEPCYPCEVGARKFKDSGEKKAGAKFKGFSQKKRLRREIRDLHPDQWDAYVFAMWEMKNLSMEEGQKRYGKAFKTFDYFAAQHAYAGTTLEGDQAHFGAHFMSFHSMFVLMFEESLLAVAKKSGRKLDGLPYWYNLDDPTGSVLSDNYFGTHPGRGQDFVVDDGAFAFWPIRKFDIADWEEYITDPAKSFFAGNKPGSDDSQLRGFPLTASTPYYTAYPYEINVAGVEVPYTGFDYETALACLDEPYDPEIYTVFNFTACISNNIGALPSGLPFGDDAWHDIAHIGVGGSSFTLGTNAPGPTYGDLADIVASPNGPLFMPLHAYFDMILGEWKSRNAEYANVVWGMPYDKGYTFFLVPPFMNNVFPGVNGNDVISYNWPITRADIGMASYDSKEGAQLVTHAEAHCWTAKENAPYQYVRYSGAPGNHPGIDDPSNQLV